MGTHYVAQAELKLTIFQESLVVHAITPNYKSQIVVIFHFAICARVFCLNVCLYYHLYVLCIWRPEEGIEFPRTGIIDGFAPHCGHRVSNLSALND